MSELGIQFTKVPQLQARDNATILVIGESVPTQLDLSRLSPFVAKGGRVLVLRQDRAPAGLPVPLSLTNKDSSICYRRAHAHPLLRGLSDSDLKYWRGDHLVTKKEYAKPVRGSFRCLLDSGTLKGLDCTPLIEIHQGRGRYILSQLRLVGKWRTEPMAAEILRRLVSPSAVAPAPSVPKLGLMVSKGSRLPGLLEGLRVCYRGVADLSGLRALLAEADAIGDGDVKRLLAFVQAGGTLWVRRVTPKCQTVCEQIVGSALELKPPVRGYADRCYRIIEHPLLSGLSNEELYWKEPHFCPGPDRGASLERIADFVCRPLEPTKGVELTRPATLVVFPRGKGLIIIDQLRWDEALTSVPELASRLVCMLLTNVGVQVGPPSDRRQ